MSTPSGKLPEFLDLAAHVEQQTRQAESAFLQPPEECRKERGGETQPPTIADREIERIEESLRQLRQRELTGRGLPRGPNLPAPDGGNVFGRRAEMLDGLKRLHSLEPTQLPPPPLQPIHNLHVILGVFLACMGGVLACYYFVFAPSSRPTIESQMASLPSTGINTPQAASSRGPRLDREPDWVPRTTAAQTDVSPAGKLPELNTAPEALIDSQQPVNTKRESAAEQPAIADSRKAVPTLQPEEIRLLVEQGERFIAEGDIITARMIFERAVKTGDAAAAMALAAAYDPIVLTRRGVLGIDTDVEKARAWYQKAQSLGAAQALERLNALASR
jgi:hypothetical protein